MQTTASFNQLLAARARHWQLRNQSVTFSPLPRLMGVINVTPDSFSDGGEFGDAQRAIEHALRLEDQGADLLDIGGESTRPYAEPVSVDEELRRVMPVLEGLIERVEIPLSIDTSKAAVARAALDVGVEIVNDVTAFADAEMREVVGAYRPGVCAMHMQGTPQTMQDNPTYSDVVLEVGNFLHGRREELLAAGLNRPRICLDPGIGFGKSTEHNVALIRNCWRLHVLSCPLLVGFSRKGFIGKVLGDLQADRLAGGIGVALSLARQAIQILRVHDVAPFRQALQLFQASGGQDEL